MRLLLLSYPRLTPFVTAGVAVSFNNGMEGADRAAVSLTGGVGLRWYIIPPIFVQAELLVAWVAKQARPVIQGDDALDERAFAVPVLLSAGLELWP